MPNATLNTTNTNTNTNNTNTNTNTNTVPANSPTNIDSFNTAQSKPTFQLPGADIYGAESAEVTRMAALKAQLNAWLLNDNAAFIPTLLVSLLLLLILVVLSAKGYSQKPTSLADAMVSPHASENTDASASDTIASAEAGSIKHNVVLPPEPMVKPKTAPMVTAIPDVAPPPALPVAAVPLPTPLGNTKTTANTPSTTADVKYSATFQQGCDALVRTKAAIQFEPRTNYLNAASKRSLEPLLACFKGHAVRISGHTDSIGTPERKLEVSQLRAGAIKEYLISQGVPAAQLQATGMSDSKPLADNETPEGRAKNRRIEFVLEALTK
jgi:outer membrane protein OmpA-like peptidoglycan-associated protein